MADRYGPSKLIVLEYHPTSDELGTQHTNLRMVYYNARGTPNIFFNGTHNIVGGGPGIMSMYEKMLKPLLGQPAGIDVSMTGKVKNTQATASAKVTLDKKSSIAGMTLRWVLFEYKARGRKGYYNYVVRDYTDLYGMVKSGKSKTFSVDFSAPKGVNAKNLGIALLIQDDGSKEIVASGVVNLGSSKSK